MSSPASDLTNQIINEIYSTGGYAWRSSSTGIHDASKGIHRTAPKKGVSDVLGIYRGVLLAIEVKIGSDRMSPEQSGFHNNIQHHGGCPFVARDFPSFQEWWRKQQAWISMIDRPPMPRPQ